MAGKRPNGEGSLYFDEKRQRWEARLTVGYSDEGRPVRRKVTGRSQEDVLARLDELRRGRRTGLPVPDRLRTVRRLLDDWLEGLPGTVAVGTLATYKRVVRLYLNPSIGARRLVDLTPGDVSRMLDDMSARGLSPETRRLARAVLRRALRTAEQQGWIARNVAAIADGPKITRTPVKVLEADDARTLLTAARGHRLEAAIVLALTLGLRRGELFGLTWADLDLEGDAPQVRVRRQTQRIEGEGMALVDLKTARSRRVLTMPPMAVDALRAHRRRQAAERLALGPAWAEGAPSDDLVFTTADGGAVDPRNFHRSLVRLARRAGLEGVRPHMLRHSAVSLLLDQGVPLDDVSELAGHSSVRVTKDCYGHMLEGGRQRAADAMQRALG